ncbi:MAG: hypothetical protein AB7O96_08920 [Pseudobdellovibrionaceae bacterium]
MELTRYTRMMGIPSYGIGPIMAADRERVRAHGVDERFYVGNLQDGVDFFHRLVVMLAAPAETTFGKKPSKNFKDAFGSEKSHHGPTCVH